MEALVEELTALQKENSTEKAIVFSQFVAFLDLIQWRLSRAGFNVVKLDGRMAPQQRDTVRYFILGAPIDFIGHQDVHDRSDRDRLFDFTQGWRRCTQFDGSISLLRDGSVVESRLRRYTVTISANFSSDQAFDRIHRLGQYRPIKITRMIIENSIESRILQLQEKKKALFDSTVGKDMAALAQVPLIFNERLLT